MLGKNLSCNLISKVTVAAVLCAVAALALAAPAQAQLNCYAARVLEAKQWTALQLVGAKLELGSGQQVSWILCDLKDTNSVKTADCFSVLATITAAVSVGNPVVITFGSGVPVDVTASPQVAATTCGEIAQWQNLEPWLNMVTFVAN